MLGQASFEGDFAGEMFDLRIVYSKKNVCFVALRPEKFKQNKYDSCWHVKYRFSKTVQPGVT
jgi:hypothetical protein